MKLLGDCSLTDKVILHKRESTKHDEKNSKNLGGMAHTDKGKMNIVDILLSIVNVIVNEYIINRTVLQLQ